VFLAFRQTAQYFHHLGRETFLAPVEWVNDWPVINNNQPIEIKMDVTTKSKFKQEITKDYQTTLNKYENNWVFLRNPDESLYEFSNKGLLMRGNRYNLSDIANPAFYAVRQTFLNGEAEFDFSFTLSSNDEAGISVFYKFDAHYDLFVTVENKQKYLVFRKVVGDIDHIANEIPISSDEMQIKIITTAADYTFYAKLDNEEVMIGKALTRYVSTEAHVLGFTGVFFALYTTSSNQPSSSKALFKKVTLKSFD
jgi:alpha-N-arabinofuranosidase